MPTDESPTEILADEVADVAIDDPERAARMVSAVTASRPPTSPPPVTAAPAARPTGFMSADKAVPAALVGVLLIQGLTRGRIKRLGLAVLGSALVAGLVAGKQEHRH